MGEKAISGNIARSARLLRAILMMETPHPLWATCTSPEHLHQDSKKKKKGLFITFNWIFWYYRLYPFSLVHYHSTTEKVVAAPSLLLPISIFHRFMFLLSLFFSWFNNPSSLSLSTCEKWFSL